MVRGDIYMWYESDYDIMTTWLPKNQDWQYGSRHTNTLRINDITCYNLIVWGLLPIFIRMKHRWPQVGKYDVGFLPKKHHLL